LVRLARRVAEEHLRQRGGAPVEDRDRPIERGARAEQEVPRAGVAGDAQVAADRRRGPGSVGRGDQRRHLLDRLELGRSRLAPRPPSTYPPPPRQPTPPTP